MVQGVAYPDHAIVVEVCDSMLYLHLYWSCRDNGTLLGECACVA